MLISWMQIISASWAHKLVSAGNSRKMRIKNKLRRRLRFSAVSSGKNSSQAICMFLLSRFRLVNACTRLLELLPKDLTENLSLSWTPGCHLRIPRHPYRDLAQRQICDTTSRLQLDACEKMYRQKWLPPKLMQPTCTEAVIRNF